MLRHTPGPESGVSLPLRERSVSHAARRAAKQPSCARRGAEGHGSCGHSCVQDWATREMVTMAVMVVVVVGGDGGGGLLMMAL